jgi:NitT/TauT family transport system ATP-binding protein
VYLSDEVIVMSARPGRVLETINIDIGRPRAPEVRYSSDFVDYVQSI